MNLYYACLLRHFASRLLLFTQQVTYAKNKMEPIVLNRLNHSVPVQLRFQLSWFGSALVPVNNGPVSPEPNREQV